MKKKLDTLVFDKLRNSNIKPTYQRIKILTTILSRKQHLSADQIISIVNHEFEDTSKATVYNTLNLFVKSGIIKEVIVDTSKIFYDSRTEPHHHLYNTETGEITDIDYDEIKFKNYFKLPDNTSIESTDIVLRIRKSN